MTTRCWSPVVLAIVAWANSGWCAEPTYPETSIGDPKEQETLVFGAGTFSPVEWPASATRYGLGHLVVTGAGAGAALAAAIVGPNRENPNVGRNDFDEAVRDALRPNAFRSQLAAKDVSDVLLGFSLSYAFFGDALVNAAWLRQSPDVASEIALIDLEVLALTLGVQQLTANLVSRERPYGRTCGTDFLDENNAACVINDRYLSHFSGHSSVTFALAASTCFHNQALPLAGRRGFIPCIAGFATAAATATLRVVADQHYASDVLTGAFVGSSIGFLVPFFHYGIGGFEPGVNLGSARMMVLPTPEGVLVTGSF